MRKKSLLFIPIFVVHAGVVVMMALGLRTAGGISVASVTDRTECITPDNLQGHTLAGLAAEGIEKSALVIRPTLSDYHYICHVDVPATSVIETVGVAIGLFVGTLLLGLAMVWVVKFVLGALKYAVAPALDGIGSTYNDNRSINIVNIEGRRYIIKDDKAIPLDE